MSEAACTTCPSSLTSRRASDEVQDGDGERGRRREECDSEGVKESGEVGMMLFAWRVDGVDPSDTLNDEVGEADPRDTRVDSDEMRESHAERNSTKRQRDVSLCSFAVPEVRVAAVRVRRGSVASVLLREI